MVAQSDGLIEIARLQKEIMGYLGLEQQNIIFNYSNKDGVNRLDVITINPMHDQSFLFHTTKGINQLEAAQKMHEYVVHHHRDEGSYTIQWMKQGEDQLHTSYFKSKNIYEALDKFYYDRDLNSYTIFSINLNPVA